MTDNFNGDGVTFKKIEEYVEMQVQIVEDSGRLLPMLDDEAKALFLRINSNYMNMMRIVMDGAFLLGADLATLEDGEE